MDDDRGRDALALAEAALALATRDGVTEAEALVTAEDSALTRFANSEIHQNVAETNVAINLRAVVGNRAAAASTSRPAPQGLALPARRAAGGGGRPGQRERPGGGGARRLGRPPRPGRGPTPARREQPDLRLCDPGIP